MYKNILVAVDGSDNNRCAVRTAVDLAKNFDAKLTAVYVENVGYRLRADVAIQDDPMKNADVAFQFIKEVSAEKGVEVQYLVSIGHPGEAITDMSADYDLVVCGTLGRSGLKKAVLGSVSEMITRFSACPVLLVRSKKA
ncbi:MAG: universal stress protein [Candidatus Methanomethylophilaceae archaeon]|nr:universal stress protein [Candidatus Methanomethylophilaceae archaeon]